MTREESARLVIDAADVARKTYGHHRPLQDCEILLKDHHEGYIDWEEFERNQKQLAANAWGREDGAKSGRGGRALLAGLLVCRRVRRRLSVSTPDVPASPFIDVTAATLQSARAGV